MIVCKSAEWTKDFKVAGYVKSFAYEEYNEEVNIEGENIRLLNGAFFTYCIVYYERNQYTKTTYERTMMIEQDYKVVLQRIDVIVNEAKEV